MARKNFTPLLSHLLLSILFLFPFLLHPSAQSVSQTKTYIIHVSHPPSPLLSSQRWHLSFFDNPNPTSLLYSYKNVLSGFAARITDSELEKIKAKPSFLRADPDFFVPLATTHTPDFLGLRHGHKPSGLWNASNFGRGIIVAVLDTGVLPNHPSFNASGMPPPPAKWKGKCEFNFSSACNNKIIGARVFLKGERPIDNSTFKEEPLDTAGHGTHTAGTAVGGFVSGASALRNAAGMAVGMAPDAHLAVYKICTEFACAGIDILAGIDAAIEEGADVISMSLGGASVPFDEDPTAVGTFAAMEKGIFVSVAAGNNGPHMGTLSNEAPWMMMVGASTMDRVIETAVKLGNGEEYKGESLYQTDAIEKNMLPLIYPGASGNVLAKFCYNNSLGVDVKGKIVICDRGGGMGLIEQGAVVKGAGAAGIILAAQESDGYTTVADAHVLPACHVNFATSVKIKSYINSTASPTATILPHGTIIGNYSGNPAPVIATFSSRGPTHHSKGILKPDIIGPGVNVLAAWPALPIGPFNSPSLFNVLSGTSMSTPHLSGIAALLKCTNPTWSPAAIRSAMMTTAENENNAGKSIANEQMKSADLFSRGAGHVSPDRANKPGFIYDIDPTDYIKYMCGLNYSDQQVTLVARRTVNCSTIEPIYDAELNYPSFFVEMRPSSSRKLTRKVKNVGDGSSSYEVEVVPPAGITVVVSPLMLAFKKIGEELIYTVEFLRDGSKSSVNYTEGYLKWVSSNSDVSVRSPILVALVPNLF